jgi:hypothetical protein
MWLPCSVEKAMYDADQTTSPSPPRGPERCPSEELCHVPLCASDAARSARNIAEWNSYLPASCVRTMVRMGWDYST